MNARGSSSRNETAGRRAALAVGLVCFTLVQPAVGAERTWILPRVPTTPDAIYAAKTIIVSSERRVKRRSSLVAGNSIHIEGPSEVVSPVFNDVSARVARILSAKGYQTDLTASPEGRGLHLIVDFGTEALALDPTSMSDEIRVRDRVFHLEFESPPRSRPIFVHYVYLKLLGGAPSPRTRGRTVWDGLAMLGDFFSRDPGQSDEQVLVILDVLVDAVLEDFGETTRSIKGMDWQYRAGVSVRESPFGTSWSWIGRTKDEVTGVFGEPLLVKPDGSGGSVLEYGHWWSGEAMWPETPRFTASSNEFETPAMPLPPDPAIARFWVNAEGQVYRYEIDPRHPKLYVHPPVRSENR